MVITPEQIQRFQTIDRSTLSSEQQSKYDKFAAAVRAQTTQSPIATPQTQTKPDVRTAIAQRNPTGKGGAFAGTRSSSSGSDSSVSDLNARSLTDTDYAKAAGMGVVDATGIPTSLDAAARLGMNAAMGPMAPVINSGRSVIPMAGQMLGGELPSGTDIMNAIPMGSTIQRILQPVATSMNRPLTNQERLSQVRAGSSVIAPLVAGGVASRFGSGGNVPERPPVSGDVPSSPPASSAPPDASAGPTPSALPPLTPSSRGGGLIMRKPVAQAVGGEIGGAAGKLTGLPGAGIVGRLAGEFLGRKFAPTPVESATAPVNAAPVTAPVSTPPPPPAPGTVVPDSIVNRKMSFDDPVQDFSFLTRKPVVDEPPPAPAPVNKPAVEVKAAKPVKPTPDYGSTTPPKFTATATKPPVGSGPSSASTSGLDIDSTQAQQNLPTAKYSKPKTKGGADADEDSVDDMASDSETGESATASTKPESSYGQHPTTKYRAKQRATKQKLAKAQADSVVDRQTPSEPPSDMKAAPPSRMSKKDFDDLEKKSSVTDPTYDTDMSGRTEELTNLKKYNESSIIPDKKGGGNRPSVDTRATRPVDPLNDPARPTSEQEWNDSPAGRAKARADQQALTKARKAAEQRAKAKSKQTVSSVAERPAPGASDIVSNTVETPKGTMATAGSVPQDDGSTLHFTRDAEGKKGVHVETNTSANTSANTPADASSVTDTSSGTPSAVKPSARKTGQTGPPVQLKKGTQAYYKKTVTGVSRFGTVDEVRRSTSGAASYKMKTPEGEYDIVPHHRIDRVVQSESATEPAAKPTTKTTTKSTTSPRYPRMPVSSDD